MTTHSPLLRTSSLDHVWNETVVEWTNPVRHDELLRMVGMHGAWVWAARHYREYLKTNPSDTVGPKQLRKIECAILVSMGTPRSRRDAKPYRATRNVMMMLFVALGMGTLYTTALEHTSETQASSLTQSYVDSCADNDSDSCKQVVRK